MKRIVRDDFAVNIKDLLAKRVGMQCANPNCRRPTSGPQEDPQKVLNIGVAAHITAAARNGPRYDSRLTPEERRSAENGIWVCQNCAKLIDNDTSRYTADLLRQWKRLSEEAARLEIESSSHGRRHSNDVDIIRFFAQCFDRPAFQDPFLQEGSMEAFDKAMEDTITAVNTGCLRSRDGAVLAQAKGKAYLQNANWRARMDAVVDLLRAVRSRYTDAERRGVIHGSDRGDGTRYYCIHDPMLAAWMDETRAQVPSVFAEVCHEAGVPRPIFPRRIPR